MAGTIELEHITLSVIYLWLIRPSLEQLCTKWMSGRLGARRVGHVLGIPEPLAT